LPEPYYQDKWVTIYHGDCREILPELEARIDLVISDPPFEQQLYGVNEQYSRIINGMGVVLWFSKFPHTGRTQVEAERFFQCIGEYVWNTPESTGFRSKQMPLCKHEIIFAFSQSHIYSFNGEGCQRGCKIKLVAENIDSLLGSEHLAPHGGIYKTNKNRKSRCANYYWVNKDWITDVITIPKPQHFILGQIPHPEDKPIGVKPPKLIDLFIQLYTNLPATILDPFLGSGTTTYCAKKLGRRSIGIEIEEKYCEIATNRCRQMVMEF